MKLLYQYIIFGLLIMSSSPSLNAQWAHDFSAVDLSAWTGDVEQFRVNEQQQLQLNAPSAGSSLIFRESKIDFDTVSFGIYHKLDFAPSDNNKSRIYLAIDNQDITTANGYFIEIGENGSNDALKFFYLNNGISELIATASMGALASEPAEFRLAIDIHPSGLWSVRTNYEGEVFTSLDVEFMDNRFDLKESKFFGLSCLFSSTRIDKFFYDDLFLKAFEKDTSPPQVVSALPISNSMIRVLFNEPVMESDALMLSNYVLDNGLGNPVLIELIGSLGNEVGLTFGSAFDASLNYNLSIMGLEDLNGNVMSQQSFQFLFAGQPEKGDLLLSEILFDPYTNGEDFVEIYNASNKNLDLTGIIIRNDQRNESLPVSSKIVIAPQSYLAFTEDVSFLEQEYKPQAGAKIVFENIPAFNNDQGNVMIINSNGIVLDSFDYHEDLHFVLIDDTEGVSLERVSYESDTNGKGNWQSAAQNVRFATPGYENSNKLNLAPGGKNFTMVTETFSPNQDGFEDRMIINYVLEKAGFVANINVYDAAGFKIRNLSSNELLGTEGIVVWDGTDDESRIANLGIYVLLGEVFHADGDVLTFKMTTVLADFID